PPVRSGLRTRCGTTYSTQIAPSSITSLIWQQSARICRTIWSVIYARSARASRPLHMGARTRELGGGGPGDVDGTDLRGWVAAVRPELGDRGKRGHRILMPGRGGDRQLVRGAAVGPTTIFFPLVASSA